MALLRASESEISTGPELFKLGSPATPLLLQALQGKNSTGISSLVQYSDNFSSRYSLFFQKALVASVARDLVSCRFAQGALDSSCRRYVYVTGVMHCYLKPLKIVEELEDEAAREISGAIRSALLISLGKSSRAHMSVMCCSTSRLQQRTDGTEKRGQPSMAVHFTRVAPHFSKS